MGDEVWFCLRSGSVGAYLHLKQNAGGGLPFRQPTGFNFLSCPPLSLLVRCLTWRCGAPMLPASSPQAASRLLACAPTRLPCNTNCSSSLPSWLIRRARRRHWPSAMGISGVCERAPAGIMRLQATCHFLPQQVDARAGCALTTYLPVCAPADCFANLLHPMLWQPSHTPLPLSALQLGVG